MEISLKSDYTSVGWCVTEDGKIKKKKKDMIGVSLFDKASTNVDRRTARISTRRLKRKKARINFLIEIFRDELNKKDPEFLKRLKQSGLLESDRSVAAKQLISKEEAKEFPRMFHLRSRLIRETDDDIRLVFLAVLHLFKSRGNFLVNGDLSTGDIRDFDTYYKQLRKVLQGKASVADGHSEEMSQIVKSGKAVRVKVKELLALLEIPKEECKYAEEIFKLILGGNSNLTKLFPEELCDMEEFAKFTFGSEACEDMIAVLETVLDEKGMEIINVCNAIYNWNILDSLLSGEQYVCDAYKKEAREHREDRELLISILKDAEKMGYVKGVYYEMFELSQADTVVNNYCCYTGKFKNKKKQHETCDSKAFYQYVTKKLNEIEKRLDEQNETTGLKESILKCKERMAEEKFCPKPRTRRNAYVPNQLLKAELEQILEKAATKHPFLLAMDEECGLTKSEKILAMFSFKIPYYLGPLDKSKYAWCEWRDNKKGPVYPWNLHKKIDVVKTRRNYFQSIIGECSVLFDERVLPDASYYNRALLCLNELDRIYIDGAKLSQEERVLIWEELFLKHDTVTEKGVISLLEEKNLLQPLAYGHETSGFVKKKLVHNMSPYVRAKAAYPEITIDEFEIIAEAVAVCKSDRELLLKYLSESGIKLDMDAIKALLNVVKDCGWSEYSPKFICGLPGASKETGEAYSNILEALKREAVGLNSLLGPGYTFFDDVVEHNSLEGKASVKTVLNKIKNPVIRREFTRLYDCALDIKKYLKNDVPEKIYLNIYALDNRPNRIVFQKKQITSLLKKSKAKELLEKAQEEKYPISMKKYLWYMQKGKCLFSGKSIPYDKIEGNDFTLEHILPKSKVYNEGSSNLCLVDHTLNQDKGNFYPIDETIREDMKDFWDELYKEGYMTDAKYEFLNSSYGIPAEQKIETVKTLLEESRKYHLIAKSLLETLFPEPETEIIFISNECLKQLKNKLDIYQDASVNEYGPAVDAYLMSVCGAVWRDVFTDNPRSYIMENKDYSLNIYNYDSKYWKADGSTAMEIEQEIDKAHFLQTCMKVTNESGTLYNLTLLNKEYVSNAKTRCVGRAGAYADETKYGGYNSIKNSYLTLFKSSDGTVRFEGIAIMDQHKGTEQVLKDMGYDVAEIIQDRIPMKCPVLINGQKYYLLSASSNVIILGNAVSLHLKVEDMRYFWKVERAYWQLKQYGQISSSLQLVVTSANNKDLFYKFFEKYHTLYRNRINAQHEKIGKLAEKFDELDMEKQCELLINVMALASRKGIAKLSVAGLSENTGKMTVGKNFSKSVESLYMVDESVTGLYSKMTKIM